jgi:hypothetical protein
MSGQPRRMFLASPTVSNGVVYIGSNTGVFYALDLSTGTILWQRFLGFSPKKTCGAQGIVSTAAVASDPITGRQTVYVGGGDGYVYALDAVTGNVVWRSVVGILPSPTSSDYFNWSSPAVANGVVYTGISSDCDNPFVPGGVEAFDQSSGAWMATHYSVPDAGSGPGDGGGVWTSPAVDGSGDVWVTTGSGPSPPAPQGEMYSVVQLAPGSLNLVDMWTVPVGDRPGDADFASSPVPITARIAGDQTQLIVACNKNGVLYALNAASPSSGPVWKRTVGIGTGNGVRACLAAPVWDGAHLFEGGNPTTIGSVQYSGSVRELDPATGGALWETGLGGPIIGSPSVNINGVLAASTYTVPAGGTNGTYLVDGGDGSILAFLPASAGEFSQPVFADGFMLIATQAGTLTAYAPRTSGDKQPPDVPPQLQAAWNVDGSAIDVSWAPSSEDVVAYRVFRNGVMIATVTGDVLSFSDSGASASANNAYSVEAVDATGNVSRLASAAVVIPTEAGPIFADGFESGNLARWTNSKQLQVQTSVVDSGNWAARATSTGGKSFAYVTFAADNPQLYVKERVFVISHGAKTADLITVKNGIGGTVATVSLSANGALITRDGVTGAITRSSTVMTTGTWHTVEFTVDVNGSAGSSEVWLDGTALGSLTLAGNYGSSAVGLLEIGDQHVGRTFDIAYDNVAVDRYYIQP